MSQVIKRKVNDCSSDSSTSSTSNEVSTNAYIGPYEEAPLYTLDNRYLRSGYRINYTTIPLALRSILHIHNETANIWSHGLAMLVSICLITSNVINDHIPLLHIMGGEVSKIFKLIDSRVPIWPLQYCLATSVYLFGSSTVYHTFFCTNKHLSCVLLRLDYSGICLIASGGILPIIQYGFHCNTELRDNYTILLLGSCLITYLASLADGMHSEHFVLWKSLIYVVFYIVALIPAFHLLYNNRFGLLGDHFDLYPTEKWIALVLLFLFLGVVLYASRFPEKWHPIKFDIYCNSHTLWHICVILAFTSVYCTSISIYIQRATYLCS